MKMPVAAEDAMKQASLLIAGSMGSNLGSSAYA
jgi:hypothetical protein